MFLIGSPNLGLLILIVKKKLKMLFYKKKKTQELSQHTIGYGGDIIKQSKAHVHLRLHFQADETWTNHITNIHEMACTRLNILRLLKHVIDRNFLTKSILLYSTLL